MSDLVIENGRVLVEAADGPRLIARDVAITGGRIAALHAPGTAGPAEARLDAAGCIVLPGLVNAHTHSPENLALGRAERAEFAAWMAAVWTDLDGLAPAHSRLAVLMGVREMIRTGVTGVVDHLRRFPMTAETLRTVIETYAETGIAACVPAMLRDATDAAGRPVDAPHLGNLPGAAEQIALVREFAPLAARHGVRLGLGPSAPHRCSDRLLDLLAEDTALPIHTHVDETAEIAASAKARFGRSTVAELSARGLLGPSTALAHCVAIEPDDRALIAESGAVAIHNPLANMRLGSGTADIPALLEAGATVALGTDGAASNDGQNLWESLKLAALLPRRPGTLPAIWPTSAAILAMASRDGHKVLRAPQEAAEAGTIRPGAIADLAIFPEDADGLGENVAARLVLGPTNRIARHVVAGGRVLMEAGRLTTIDEAALDAALSEMSGPRMKEYAA